MHRQRPRYTLFPYTTLFRSTVVSQPVTPATDEPREDVFIGPPNERRAVVRASETTTNGMVGALGESQSRAVVRSEEHTSELQSPYDLVCRLLLEKKNDTMQK